MTYEEANEAFNYDPETGVLTNKVNRGTAKVGEEAGGYEKEGYRKVSFKYKNNFSHRVAWLLYCGEWPKDQIDHINGIKDDNRISNLRDVSNQENHRNRKHHKHNTSGFRGVNLHREKEWRAYITSNSQHHHLGLFDCFLDAVAARMRAEKEHNFHENHGRSI